MTDLSKIKALTWDVGGTVFDWRGTIQEEVRRLAAEQDAQIDVEQFAQDWRSWSFQTLGRVNNREIPWTNFDFIHRAVLDDVLEKHSALSLSTSERDDLTDVWHRLKAWPDAADGLEKLRSRYTVIVLSWAIAVDCSKHNGISWDGILSCEFLPNYKGSPAAYNTALRLLRVEPSEAMMVAAHLPDIRNAKAVGMHGAYVHREGESNVLPGWSDLETAREDADIVAVDFPDLADQLLA